MEQLKVVKINSGSAVHLAEYFITPSNVEGHEVYCGSGKTGFRNVKRSAGKFSPDKITCKKCKKRYEEEYANATEQRHNLKDWEAKYGKQEEAEEELSIAEYVAKHGKTFYLPKKK